jgi:hypothetical protein
MRRRFLVALSLLVASLGTLRGEGKGADGDLFSVIETGQVEVKLFPHDATGGTVIITNTTKEPLTIKLPEAFAGVPVLAQRRGGGAAAGVGGNTGATGAGNQAIGGAFGGGGLGGGGFGGGLGGGGGLFNIGPERARKLKVAAVCLEHGKQDPNPRVDYELVPIGAVTSDPAVSEVLKMLGRREIDQPAAQAAAWHIANGLSWQQLAEKIGVKHIGGRTEPYFSAAAIERAQHAVSQAHRRAAENPAARSPGELALGRE